MESEGVCPFCQMPSERIIIENRMAYAVLDLYPVTAGHTLVIPKRHVTSFRLSDEEVLGCDSLLRKLQVDLSLEDPSIQGYNIGMNIGRAAGQTIFHYHIHLIPRRIGDVDDPRGGIRHVISGKGYYSIET